MYINDPPPTLRLKGAYYALATVGFAEGFRVILVSTEKIGNWATGGAQGFLVPLMGNAPQHMQFMSKVPYYYIALILVVIITRFCARIDRSKLGYYLTALREDEDAALSLGINGNQLMYGVWLILRQMFPERRHLLDIFD